LIFELIVETDFMSDLYIRNLLLMKIAWYVRDEGEQQRHGTFGTIETIEKLKRQGTERFAITPHLPLSRHPLPQGARQRFA
jgi:hypothetical protein